MLDELVAQLIDVPFVYNVELFGYEVALFLVALVLPTVLSTLYRVEVLTANYASPNRVKVSPRNTLITLPQ